LSPKAESNALVYTPEQAAPLIVSTPGTMARWRRTGKGPRFIRVGKKIAYRRSDLEAWLDGQTYSNTAQGKGRR
jgi:hypothetical protein